MKQEANGQYLTLQQTAELAGAAYATVRRDIDNGRLAAYKVGRKYFVESAAAAAYAGAKRELAATEGYSIKEIMEILPLSYAYVIELIKRGRLQAVKCGRRYIISQAELERFLEGSRMEKE